MLHRVHLKGPDWERCQQWERDFILLMSLWPDGREIRYEKGLQTLFLTAYSFRSPASLLRMIKRLSFSKWSDSDGTYLHPPLLFSSEVSHWTFPSAFLSRLLVLALRTTQFILRSGSPNNSMWFASLSYSNIVDNTAVETIPSAWSRGWRVEKGREHRKESKWASTPRLKFDMRLLNWRTRLTDDLIKSLMQLI